MPAIARLWPRIAAVSVFGFIGVTTCAMSPAAGATSPPPVSVISSSGNCTLDGQNIDVADFKNSDTVAHAVGLAFNEPGSPAPPSLTPTRVAPAGQTVEVRAVHFVSSAVYDISFVVDGTPLPHYAGPALACGPAQVETRTIVSGQSIPVDTCSSIQVNIAPAHGRLTYSAVGGESSLGYASPVGFVGRDYFQTLCGDTFRGFSLRLDDIHVIVTAAAARPVLAKTGSPAGPLAIFAGLLLATGSLLALAARRRVR